MTSRVTRVLIADDHRDVRESVRTMLTANLAVEVIAEVATGEDAVNAATRLRPDVVILDLRMLGLNGIAAASRMRESAPGTAVVLFSLSFDKQHILAALQAGASACVAKQDGLDCLADAIEPARSGGHFFSPYVLAELRGSLAALFSNGLSAGTRQDSPALFDQEAPALFRCARAIGANDQEAASSVEESFLAYWMLLGSGGTVENTRAWLAISVASHLFSRLHARPRPTPMKFLSVSRWFGDWYHEMRPAHARTRDFADYWQGAMSAAARSRLLGHVQRCPSCHLDWSLVAFVTQSAESSAQSLLAQLLEQPGPLAATREELIRLWWTADVARFAIAWARREIRLRELVATDLEVLLGSAAAREWRQPKSWSSTMPVAWTTEFLGGRIAPLALVTTSRLRS